MATETGNSVNQKQGIVMICPNCGGNLKAFASICELCGHELSDVSASRTVSEIAARFEEIESELNRAGFTGIKRERELVSRRARVIRDFPIPNSRSDLQSLIYFIHPKIQNNLKPDANAEDWRVKFNEVITLAKNAYKGDAKTRAEFEEIEKSLQTTLAGDLRTKARRSPIAALVIGVVIFAAVVGMGAAQYSRWKLKQCEERYATGAEVERNRLTALMASAQSKLAQKNYSEALALLGNIGWQYKEACKLDEAGGEQAAWESKKQRLIAETQKARDQEAAERREAADRETNQQKAELAREEAAKREEAERAHAREVSEKVNNRAAERKAATSKEW
mgnify:CR=1 FL=1